MYLVLKLLGPVELVSVLLQKQDLSFEDADIVDCLPEVIRQVDHLVVEVFVILMPLYHADILICAQTQKLGPFLS